jgi:hypothetical protein
VHARPQLFLHVIKAFQLEELPGAPATWTSWVSRALDAGQLQAAAHVVAHCLQSSVPSGAFQVDEGVGALREDDAALLIRVVAGLCVSTGVRVATNLLSPLPPHSRVAILTKVRVVVEASGDLKLSRQLQSAASTEGYMARLSQTPLLSPNWVPPPVPPPSGSATGGARPLQGTFTKSGDFSNMTARIPMFGVRSGSRLQSSNGAKVKRPPRRADEPDGPDGSMMAAGGEASGGDVGDAHGGDAVADAGEEAPAVSVSATVAAAAAMPSFREAPAINPADLARSLSTLSASLVALVAADRVATAVSLAGCSVPAQQVLVAELLRSGRVREAEAVARALHIEDLLGKERAGVSAFSGVVGSRAPVGKVWTVPLFFASDEVPGSAPPQPAAPVVLMCTSVAALHRMRATLEDTLAGMCFALLVSHGALCWGVGPRTPSTHTPSPPPPPFLFLRAHWILILAGSLVFLSGGWQLPCGPGLRVASPKAGLPRLARQHPSSTRVWASLVCPVGLHTDSVSSPCALGLFFILQVATRKHIFLVDCLLLYAEAKRNPAAVLEALHASVGWLLRWSGPVPPAGCFTHYCACA